MHTWHILCSLIERYIWKSMCAANQNPPSLYHSTISFLLFCSCSFYLYFSLSLTRKFIFLHTLVFFSSSVVVVDWWMQIKCWFSCWSWNHWTNWFIESQYTENKKQPNEIKRIVGSKSVFQMVYSRFLLRCVHHIVVACSQWEKKKIAFNGKRKKTQYHHIMMMHFDNRKHKNFSGQEEFKQ